MAYSQDRPANRLSQETSPYLLQHAYNPVAWYPWSPEAFEKAKAEDKPIFLSVGYSACHWCHVMERESFESESIAAFMNDNFVNIKVDREERPDVDQIYMNAVQAISGHGGWPMSVFLTPEGKPFYGGTYYPPADRPGMAGFPRVLQAVLEAWKERREQVHEAADHLTDRIAEIGRLGAGDGALDATLLDNAARQLARAFEPSHGGFGSAPKFPHPMDLRVLLRQAERTGDEHALRMVTHTLDKMARGGIYDHLGGGFARYSTDDRWLVPHFEKMLYDNALLTSAYLEAYQFTHNEEYARVARETLDYILDRMTSPEGGFYSTEDADSEGVEGKYYVWSLAELREVLGDARAEVFATVYDVTEGGNWEHQNILNLPKPIDQAARLLGRDEAELRKQLDADRAQLLAVRDRRVPPGKDTKVLTSWNGLMLAAMAEGALVLRDSRYLDAAEAAARFLLDTMRQPSGLLLHSFKDGQARFNAYLDDYSHFIDGLTRLFEVSGEGRFIESAVELAGVMIAEFHDPESGGFYYTGSSHETLISRQKDSYDNATPSGTGMASTALARLGALTGRTDLSDLASETLRSNHAILQQAPMAAGQSLIAFDFLLGPVREFAVIAGDDQAEYQQVLKALYARFLPRKVVAPALGPVAPELASLVPLLADRPARDGRATTYVCERFTCQAPVVGVEGLEKALVEAK